MGDCPPSTWRGLLSSPAFWPLRLWESHQRGPQRKVKVSAVPRRRLGTFSTNSSARATPANLQGLANARPGQLSFEGYDRLRASTVHNGIADEIEREGERLNGDVANNGHTAVLGVVHEDESDGIMTGSPDVLGEGQSYQMLQLHFHWGADNSRGSEHTINGVEFPMEMHIVHKKVGLTVEEALGTSDGLAVVGQMFEISDEDNEVLTPLIESLANIENFDAKFDMSDSPLRVQDLLPSPDSEYVNYDGSLTTPTCNEAVRWILFTQPIPISASQMDSFRALKDKGDQPIVDNYRPPQPLNGREVNFYTA